MSRGIITRIWRNSVADRPSVKRLEGACSNVYVQNRDAPPDEHVGTRTGFQLQDNPFCGLLPVPAAPPVGRAGAAHYPSTSESDKKQPELLELDHELAEAFLKWSLTNTERPLLVL